MCVRADIVLVVSKAVADDTLILSRIYGFDSRGFYEVCGNLMADPETDEWKKHWEMVEDFGLRVVCSPLSSIEIDGVIEHRCDFAAEMPEERRTRLIIGHPDTPPHVHGQGNIPVRH